MLSHARIAALLLLLAAALGAGPEPITPETVIRHLEAGEWLDARTAAEAYLARRPPHPAVLYNLACANARLNDAQGATTALVQAIKAGFRDFDHLRQDPDLESIRDEEVFIAIVAAADREERSAADAALDRWRSVYDNPEYRYEVDDERRIVFATALDDTAHREMRELLAAHTDLLRSTFFGAPPSYYVLIAVPTAQDADRFFDGDRSIGGMYDHGNRRLVVRDIGSSLQHEFVHALHYGHMERMHVRRAHPIWIIEGLATLFEDYQVKSDGTIVPEPNERTNIAIRLARRNRLTRWDDLFAMDSERFMRKSGRYYPEVRAIFTWLAETDSLASWYAAYIANYAEDPTGTAAFEAVFERPLRESELAFTAWLKKQPEVDTTVEPGDAALGIEVAHRAENDGVVVARVWPGSAARKAGLRVGDVIVAIDDRPIRTMTALQQAIARRGVGDRLQVRFRRGTTYLEREVVLRRLGSGG